MKFRKRRKKNNIFILLIIIVVNSLLIINFIGKRITPYIEQMVEKYVNRSVYNYVFYAFEREILTDEDLLNIINLNMNSEGEIISVDYKFNIAYDYLSDGMEKLYENISDLQLDFNFYDGDNNIFFVPVGMANKNILLENMGFKVPCKIIFLSDIDMGFKTKVTNYGVNNILVELYLEINVQNDLISPSSFYEFGESYEMPIASKIVVGKIPVYYGDSIEKSSAIVSS